MRIRRARPEDWRSVADLEARAFPDAWSPEQVAGELALPATRTWVAEEADGALLAYATYRIAGDEGELVRIGVDPDHRRRGIGETLLSESLRRLTREGAISMFLEVRHDNRAAVSLYERRGFRRVGERPGYYRDGTDALLYRLGLGS